MGSFLNTIRLSDIPLARVVAICACLCGASLASAQTATSPNNVLTLRALLDSVRLRHPTGEAARARVRAARGSRLTAGSLGNPILSYNVENAPFPGNDLVGHMTRENMTTAMLPLESIAQRFPRAQRASLEVRAAEADARVSEQQLALDAARAYYRAAVGQVGLAVAQDVVAWLDSVVAYNRMRVEEGAAAEVDLIRTELERDRALADATLQEVEATRARAEVATFLGASEESLGSIVVPIDSLPVPVPAAVATNLAALLEQRPDVRAARFRLNAAGAGVAVERSMIVRQLGITFGAKQSAGTTSMLAGISMPLPIFDPNRGEIARANAERDVANFELKGVERTARADLASAHEAARLLHARVAMLVRREPGRLTFLQRADEARHIALGAYREGAASLIQVLDASRAWGEARNTFYRALYAQHESVALLLTARGDDLFSILSR